jgi:D-lactate dehydrogenase
MAATLIRPSKLVPPDTELLAALEAELPGGISARATDRLGHAHDASHYLLTPLAVATPTSVDEVAALFRVATAQKRPITFRSGGTSLSGQASSDGILVDTRRNFRAIEVLDNGARVRVQPGATVRQVNARLAAYKRKLGPDPASEAACTIGGVVANNSSGMACGTEFNTYQTLESAILVLPSGTTVDTSQKFANARLRSLEPELYEALAQLRERVINNPASVRSILRQYAIKNTMGYGLNSFLDYSQPVDLLLHLTIGSEGTLAFVAEATFRTIEVKAHVATGLLVFDQLRDATSALPGLVDSGFATIELLDATSLRVAARDPDATDRLRSIPVDKHAALLVEYQESSHDELVARIRDGSRSLNQLPLTSAAVLSEDAKTRAALWHIRKGLYATVAGNRPPGSTALLEDVAVPVASLLQTCDDLMTLFDHHGYEESVIFGHAKDGNIHFLLNERFDQEASLDRYVAFTHDMVELVLGNGGNLKAEHGTGRIMAPFVRRQYGDELYEVMQAIKRACDPRGILNPGVLLNEDPISHISNLKTTPTVEREVDRCVECGYCEPVCPSKDLTMTPRQRIVLRREIADATAAGDKDLLRQLNDEYQYDGVDTCAVDGMCQTACPVLIDTGDLVRRLRSEQRTTLEQAGWRQAAKHWDAASRAGGLALGAVKRLPAPLVMGAASAARALLGPDKVPLWEPDLPQGGSRRMPRPSSNAAAVYFAACITTMFGPADNGPGVRSALLALCERAGVDLLVPDGIASMCCGTPWKSKGLTEGYDDMKSRVLPALWEASDRGRLPIICDAASCTEGLERLAAGAEELYPDPRFVDAIAFVDEHLLAKLTVTRKIGRLALHPTCSSTHLGTNEALTRIGAAIAGTVVVPDGWGCCAFAGDRGMLHPELTASATLSEARSVAGESFDAYASTNRTCELGMTRATGQQYEHLLEVLERATRPTRD